MKTDPTFWLLARASGLTAYVLLTAVGAFLGLGAQVAARSPGGSSLRRLPTDTHRFLALLGLGAIAVARGGAAARHDT